MWYAPRHALAYHMFGMTPDDLGGPLCHAKSMGRTRATLPRLTERLTLRILMHNQMMKQQCTGGVPGGRC